MGAMSLPPRTSLTWAQEIGAAAETQMNSTARWFKGGTEQFNSKARHQFLRAPLDSSTATAWGTKRAGISQIPLTAHTGLIQKGWLGQFAGGDDPALANITVTVQSAINSSHAAVRTIHWITELADTPRAP